MTDLYNMTELQEAVTLDKLITFVNDATSSLLVGTFIIAIFFIMFMALRRYGFVDSLLTSSFVCFVISLIATYIGWINIMFPLSFLAITAFTGLTVFIRKS